MRSLGVLILLCLSHLPFASTANGQVGRAAIGAGIGLLGGGVITTSLIVARARFQGEYLESVDDLFHWQGTPVLVTPLVGIGFGIAGKEPLKASIVGSTGGMVAGAAAGAFAGWALSNRQEWPWAGAAIGAGAGMTLGGLTLGLRAILRDVDEDDDVPPAILSIRIPI